MINSYKILYKIFIFITFIFLFNSCTQQKEQKSLNSFAPEVFKANGYVVPKDSMAEPKVILVDESKLKKIPVGNPKVIFTNTNVHDIEEPKVFIAGTPRIIELASDTYKLPKSILAIDSPFVAGIPEVVIAKDDIIKDQNMQNFRYFNIKQGIKYINISCMLQDKSGNLWFGIYGIGGGVSKYDGKYFTHFTQKEGLNNNSVLSILQDKIGNLWFGTDGGGVSRYDGKHFTHFTQKEGLSNNKVYCILKDKSDNLWFGTYGGGVSKYDGKYFTHFTQKEGLSNNCVLAILQDKDGNIWFGTEGGGVSKFNGKCFTNFTKKEGLSNNIVRCIFEDKSGSLWFGTEGGGVSKYNNKYFINYTAKEGLCNNYVYSILQDFNGNLWFGYSNGGVSKYNGKSFIQFTEKDGLNNNRVSSILQDKRGAIWFGTYFGDGALKLDLSGIEESDGKYALKNSSQCFTYFTENDGLINNGVSSIIQDTSGNLWFGTWSGGISKYDGKSFTNFTEKEGLCNNKVQCIIQDKSGFLWISTWGGGVQKYDGKSFINFTKKDGLSSNKVSSILQDKSGNIWFGTDSGGVSKYDGKSFTNFAKKEGLSSNCVISILQDKNGNLWFSTMGGGVTKYDGKNFIHFTEKEDFVCSSCYSMLEDKNGNLWFGTWKGVTKYDGKFFTNFTKNEGLSNNYITSILQDKVGNLWFGSELGICKLTQNSLRKLSNKPFKKLDEISGGNKYSVNGNIDLFFKLYTYEEGFCGRGCNRNSIFEDKTGTIWIGANDRLLAYHPESDETDTIPPKIQLSSIELFNEHISWSNLISIPLNNISKDLVSLKNENKLNNIVKDTIFFLGNGVNIHDFKFDDLIKWTGLPVNLSLAYNNNFLTFNFSGITKKRTNKVKYQYKLVGIDENWSIITKRTEATYGNLPQGSYTFKIKAINSEGFCSNEFNYPFIIRPPWWKTWWFRSIYISVLILSLFVFYRWRTATLRKRQKELIIKVHEATVEIRQQNEEITTQRDEIAAQRDTVTHQKNQIEKIHQEVSQSINYATRIQTAILPETSLLEQYFYDYFILFRPKDKVSGDFYWWVKVENYLIITVADCTGHGLPGAFMSMLGTSFLREIVVKEYITNPAIILKRMRKEIIHALKQKGEYSDQKDGMDMALISFNIDTLEIQFAGANNPAWIIRNGALIELKPDKMPVAIYEIMQAYTNQVITLQKGDCLFMMSDGYQDQFGGPNRKKFLSKNMKELLKTNSQFPMIEQKELLEKAHNDWKGESEQIDDITVMGIRIS